MGSGKYTEALVEMPVLKSLYYRLLPVSTIWMYTVLTQITLIMSDAG